MNLFDVVNFRIPHFKIRAFLLVVFISVALCACGGSTAKPGPIVLMKKSLAGKPQEALQDVSAREAVEEPRKPSEKSDGGAFTMLEPYKALGEKGFSQVREAGPFSQEEMVSVAIDEMPLPDFIHHVFSDILGVNYVVDSRIGASREKITLNLSKPVSEAQLFKVVGEVLSKSNVSIIPKDGVFYVWTGSTSARFSIGIGSSVRDIPGGTGMIEQLIPIRYASARNLISLIPPMGITSVRADATENILIATGPREGVEEVVQFVNALDRPSMRGRNVGMLTVKYWDLSEFIKKLSEPLVREGVPVARGGRHDGLYFIPMESMGRIIVFAAEMQWIERARYWAGVLDVPLLKDRKEFFLYYPECSRASELGESLEKILGLGGSGDARQPAASEKTVNIRKGESRPEKRAGKVVVGTKAMAGLPGDIRMTVDENRNALIIYATPDRYQEISRLLKKLDVIPQQVLLESTIAEVTLTGSFALGVEWALRNYTPKDTGNTGIFDLMAGGTGLTWAMITKGAKFELVLKALAQDSLVKILSSPNLTVRDGKSASIVVGKDVPILTQQATSDIQTEGTSGLINSIQYRTTGISLKVTPTVHARGVVTLVIDQSLTKAETTTSSKIDSPTILNRSVSTEVVVGDGQTVVLGGLIDEQGSEGESGVPFLRDIPLLGYFFKTQARSADRTELIITITPRIIRNSQQIDEMRRAVLNGLELIQMEGAEKPGKDRER